jgi:hypothetical protein
VSVCWSRRRTVHSRQAPPPLGSKRSAHPRHNYGGSTFESQHISVLVVELGAVNVAGMRTAAYARHEVR